MRTMIIKAKNKIFVISMTAMILFIFIFGYISVNSVIALSNNFNILAQHPFTVSAAVYKIQNIASENKLRMNRLVMFNDNKDYEMVDIAIKELEHSVFLETKTMEDRYLGPKSTVLEIEETFKKIVEIEEQLLEDGQNHSSDEIQEYIKNNLDPLYAQIDQLSNDMLTFINGTVKRLTKESKATVTTVVISTMFFSIALIAVGIVLKRLIDARTKERQYRDFLFQVFSDHADAVFMIYNLREDKIEFVFSNSMQILGIESSELENDKMKIFQYCHADGDSQLEEALRKNAVTSKLEKEYIFNNPVTKEEIWISFAVHPVETASSIERYILSIRDLTNIKNTQQILSDALLNAENANRAKSDFLSRMSHEIRTPMNAIIGMGNIAINSIENKVRVEDCLKKINISSKHLLMLINDILDMSKIESGKLSILNESFNITETFRNAIALIFPQTKDKKQTLEVVIPTFTNEIVIGDSLRLNQILLNILSNAIKYTPEGGEIKLEVKERSHSRENFVLFQIMISDNGIGMTEDFLKKIFEPFEQEYRQNASRSSSTGIGIAITKSLVQLMNGVITVKSEENQGTTFIVELPFEVNKESEEKFKNIPAFGNLRILFVDDDLTTCENAMLLFERMGANIQWTTSSTDAYDRVLAAHEHNMDYHIVFTDWKMFDQDGFELAKRIRDSVSAEIKIIIISSYDTEAIEDKLIYSGANEFMPKPISKSTVYNMLAETVESLNNTVDALLSGTLLPGNSLDATFAGKRILVVDDVDINLEIMDIILTERGIVVDKAVNGKEACEKFVTSQKGDYDAILMDVQMPEMNGYEATRTIRNMSHPAAASIPIIAMTADAFSEDVLMAIDAGMNFHISKPIDAEKLFEILQKSIL